MLKEEDDDRFSRDETILDLLFIVITIVCVDLQLLLLFVGVFLCLIDAV